jgi:hypothetical protein
MIFAVFRFGDQQPIFLVDEVNPQAAMPLVCSELLCDALADAGYKFDPTCCRIDLANERETARWAEAKLYALSRSTARGHPVICLYAEPDVPLPPKSAYCAAIQRAVNDGHPFAMRHLEYHPPDDWGLP